MATSVGPVLVGTDFSEAAAVALVEARRLAQLMGARVEVMHVVDGGGPAGWGESGQAGRWLQDAGLDPDGLIVRYGSPWVELARYAAEVSPTLVVVGSHGSSGYQPLSIGSTATRISVHARRPVVLVSPRVVSWTEQEAAVADRNDAAAVSPAGAGTIITDRGETR